MKNSEILEKLNDMSDKALATIVSQAQEILAERESGKNLELEKFLNKIKNSDEFVKLEQYASRVSNKEVSVNVTLTKEENSFVRLKTNVRKAVSTGYVTSTDDVFALDDDFSAILEIIKSAMLDVATGVFYHKLHNDGEAWNNTRFYTLNGGGLGMEYKKSIIELIPCGNFLSAEISVKTHCESKEYPDRALISNKDLPEFTCITGLEGFKSELRHIRNDYEYTGTVTLAGAIECVGKIKQLIDKKKLFV